MEYRSIQQFVDFKYGPFGNPEHTTGEYKAWQMRSEEREIEWPIQYIDSDGVVTTAYIQDAMRAVKQQADGTDIHTLAVVLQVGDMAISVSKTCKSARNVKINWDTVLCALEITETIRSKAIYG